ncbi:nectin-4 [Neosynchiropus ocellatus]
MSLPAVLRRMTSLLTTVSLCLCFLHVSGGGFVDNPPSGSVRARAEHDTELPCRYETTDTIVQVTWYKKKLDGTKEQIITAHHLNGQTAFGTWFRRVHFKSSDPTTDSSLIIRNTEISDEGQYVCHISTFPSGNFDRDLSMIVWSIPITTLDSEVLVEGQSYRQAAVCRSMARPPALLSWDTELTGQSSNRTSENGAVSTQFSLHPLRSMNGMKLDCLVSHPTLDKPRRLRNTLVVHYPPYAEVTGFNADWYVGFDNAVLRCKSKGNPHPNTFTWIRKGAALPDGAFPHPNGSLIFSQPISLSDAGTYQCAAKNEVGVGKAQITVTVAESQVSYENMLMIIVIAVAVGLLILMLIIVIIVSCHHKSKNKKLVRELTEKKEEISTLSRQASFRRINSVSTDTRGATEENIPLRVEGTLRTSLSSLGEQAHYRDSRSTISGGRGGGGAALDYLGRPVLHNSSRRGRDRSVDREEETRLRVETFVRNSTISLQETRLHPPLMPSPFPVVHSTEIVRQLNGSAIVPSDGSSRTGSVGKNHHPSPVSSSYPPVTDDEDEVDEGLGGPASQEHPDDRDSETNSSQVSEAHSARYHQTNGTIRPKPSTQAVSPHASFIHKAQIV